MRSYIIIIIIIIILIIIIIIIIIIIVQHQAHTSWLVRGSISSGLLSMTATGGAGETRGSKIGTREERDGNMRGHSNHNITVFSPLGHRRALPLLGTTECPSMGNLVSPAGREWVRDIAVAAGEDEQGERAKSTLSLRPPNFLTLRLLHYSLLIVSPSLSLYLSITISLYPSLPR